MIQKNRDPMHFSSFVQEAKREIQLSRPWRDQVVEAIREFGGPATAGEIARQIGGPSWACNEDGIPKTKFLELLAQMVKEKKIVARTFQRNSRKLNYFLS